MKHLPIIAMLLASSVAHAEDVPLAPPASAAPRQTTPEQAAPQPPVAGPGEKPLPSPKFAVKLAGLVIFVANACPAIKPDYARFKTAVAQLGASLEELSKDPLRIETLNYASIYQKDVDGSCARATAMFGEKGTALPGVFVAK